MSLLDDFRRERARLSVMARRERLAAAGLCQQCGRAPPAEQRTKCDACLARHRAYYRAHREKMAEQRAVMRAKRSARGRCQDCDAKVAVTGDRLCQDCRADMAARAARRYQARVAESLCVDCGGAPMPGRRHCAPCWAKRLARQNARRARAAKSPPSDQS